MKIRFRRLPTGLAAVLLAVGAVTLPVQDAYADVEVSTQSIKGADGKDYTVTNHVVKSALEKSQSDGKRKEWLLVWAGDENIADTAVPDVRNLPGSLTGGLGKVTNAAPGPDFLAVIDATPGSPGYGQVVNTITVGPLVENEPHHMQYVWHKGDTIYAGALFGAATYAFDVTALPNVKLKGISLPTQTLGGSVPDAYWVLKDGTAYATYMGGPVAPGPYRYDDGSVHVGNGFAGSPGEVVRFDENAKVLSQSPAATPGGDNEELCANLPRLGEATCANPHGIQAREDLNTLVTADYVEPRNIILDPVKAPSPYLRRPTVRTWDISDRNHPKLKAVSYLPDGPRADPADPLHQESRAVMETTVTNLPGHKGAFAQTMQGGAVFYTPDITAAEPHWRQVFDDGTANPGFDAANDRNGGSSNGGWIQTSPDDRSCTGRSWGASPARTDRTTRAPPAASTCWTSPSWSRPATATSARSTPSRKPSTAAPRRTARRWPVPPRSTPGSRGRVRTGARTTTSCSAPTASTGKRCNRSGWRRRTTSWHGPDWTVTTRSTSCTWGVTVPCRSTTPSATR
jgi:hypothetical protein